MVLNFGFKAAVTGLLFLYNRFNADITIAVIWLQQAFEGASSATANRFPYGWADARRLEYGADRPLRRSPRSLMGGAKRTFGRRP